MADFGGLSVDVRSGETVPSTSATVEPDTEPAAEELGPYGVSSWELPGQGESGPGCGEWYPESVCEACGEPVFKTRSCGRRSCPDCWGIWAKAAAVRATKRIQAFRYTQPDDWHRQVAHAVVSPPDGAIETERQYWNGRKKAADLAKSKGWRGFAVISHGYRATDRAVNEFKAADPGYGFWVWLRNDVEDMREYIRWSPHYHIIGITGRDMAEASESDDWVYSFIRSLEPFGGLDDKESHNDLYGAFRYLLSHVTYPDGSTNQVTTWNGALANSVFVEDPTEEWQHAKPSEGVRAALKRHIEEVADYTLDDDDDDGGGSETDDNGPCPVDGCDGVLIGVFDVKRFLRYNDRPPDVRNAMEACREWRLGDIEPPPGLKRPTTEEQASEAFEAILDRL